MEARAQARYVRVTPMKARRVIDLIRGLPAAEATLAYAPDVWQSGAWGTYAAGALGQTLGQSGALVPGSAENLKVG